MNSLWNWARDLPIRRKLMLIIMLTSGVALAIAASILIVRDLINFRFTLERDLTTVASVIADNSTAALSFHDSKAAAETLGALRGNPNIRSACTYDEDGMIFASYARSGARVTCPNQPAPQLARLNTETLVVYKPVV